ncbi:DUF6516 family protein [Pseudanabaena sp. ABRG5-3]|uniref:toxin-antitoxin system TumE family protein n=1 Tax=Pseudanabaena sp. ABRG5-3 TaxID=685565 RepID=UPI000DC71945|nr:DUF6516 family protein [Pseudanabaena sp. ABRG5-3]BBC22757.1 hypothetical protein ABRG53_0500 [Pseudanabaena sp. ABRG5-3]
MIEDYFVQLEEIIKEFPNIRFVSITKKIYNISQGYISGSIIFENNHRLDFVEVKNIEILNKIKYRYHYMNDEQVMIFRYDNAPHHTNVSTFPHHKHDGENIRESGEPSLDQVLLEISRNQRQL